jgi:hypothetical protein
MRPMCPTPRIEPSPSITPITFPEMIRVGTKYPHGRRSPPVGSARWRARQVGHPQQWRSRCARVDLAVTLPDQSMAMTRMAGVCPRRDTRGQPRAGGGTPPIPFRSDLARPCQERAPHSRL